MTTQSPEQLGLLFAERIGAGDLKGLLELYEEEATLVGPDGETGSGKEAICERLQGLLALAPEIEAGESRAILAGDVALLSSRWRMTFPAGDDGGQAGFEAKSTEVARRQTDGSWRYVIDDPASIGLRPPALPTSRTQASLANTRASKAEAEQLIYEEDGPVVRVTLNRPGRRNALSIQLSRS